MTVYFVGTGIMIGHILLLGELINFVPSAHPTVPLIGKLPAAAVTIKQWSKFWYQLSIKTV